MATTLPKSTRSSPSLRATDASAPSRPKLLAALRKRSAGSSDSETDSENPGSDSENEMQTVQVTTKPGVSPPRLTLDSAEEDEQSDGGNAYERMKKRLAANKKAEEPQNAQQEAPIMPEVASSGDEDEMPVRTNVRAPTAQRSKTATSPASPSPSIRSRRSSPGLFVTPNATPVKQSRHQADAGSGTDSSPRLSRSNDLQERIRRIRAERLAKERQQKDESQTSRSTKIARRRADEGSGSESDGENGRRLTQQARPTRKAGKKAMEEIARDQQRISRNMQLTHQAKTKKRFTTKDLFTKLGYNAPNDGSETLPTPDASSALASSDAEPTQLHNSQPASPIRSPDKQEKQSIPVTSVTGLEQNMDASAVLMKLDKGKGRAPEFQHLPLHPWMKQAEPVIVQNAATPTSKLANDTMVELSDSDEDIHTVQPKSRFPVFDRLPTKKQHESASLQHLRSLAQLIKSPPNGKKDRKSTNLAEWEFSLAQKARQQASEAREARIKDMRARGAHIETEEEREKRQEAIEDLVAQMEREREQDAQLAKAERNEMKEKGETIDDLPSSDEEDGDYTGSGEENTKGSDDEIDVELSGSEDELMEVEEQEQIESNNLGDDAADVDQPEVEDKLQQMDEDADVEDEDAIIPLRQQNVHRVRKRVIEDDDESDTEVVRAGSPTQQSTQSDAMAAFGFGNAVADVGLTQMFAGTMAELGSESQSTSASAPGYATEQNSLDFLRSLPDTQPGANFSQAEDIFVPNSQSLMSPQKESQTGAESQFSLGISQFVNTSPVFTRTQVEDFEPTQDAGFSFSRSPAGLVHPVSTVETVMIPSDESPIKQRQGKLQRGRRETPLELSDVEDDLADEAEESEDDIQLPPKPRDAFLKLQKAAKKQKAIDDFNKKTSMAKDAVMEQAEESEDEYAGIGGVSDDEEGEEDQELKDMIDHADVDVDERQLAAFYADEAKKEDEKNIANLYKKIQTGGLRRHAGGPGFDMSDSEDEAEMRQRKKRAAFQQQTRALLADDRVKALHDDQKKKAFFNSLADFADEGDYDFLDMPADMGIDGTDSQSQETPKEGEDIDEVIPDSQATDSAAMPAPFNPLKRKSPESSQKENRPPPNMRRTAATDNMARKPITLADVQNSVSELLDDPRVVIPDSQSWDSEDEDETPMPNAASRKPIVDRLSLSRQSTMEETAGGEANLAFHAPSRSAAIPGFRVPSLIRKATSNLSTTSQRSSGTGTPAEGVRRGGTGKSNIHAQAREAERKEMLERKEGKRKEALRKKVEGGRKRAGGMRSVLGDLGGGFE